MVFSLDAMDREFERQRRLAEEGLLRRHAGTTYGWQEVELADGSTAWAWCGVYSGIGPTMPSRDDHEEAWRRATGESQLHQLPST
jgi:hypothetical protein